MNQFKALTKACVQGVKALGYEIEISHTRPLENFVGHPGVDGGDSILSRKEFGEIVKSGDFECSDPAMEKDPKYGDFVKATGGFTRITIKAPEGEPIIAKFNFGSKENFCRSKGIYKAIMKAGLIYCHKNENGDIVIQNRK